MVSFYRPGRGVGGWGATNDRESKTIPRGHDSGVLILRHKCAQTARENENWLFNNGSFSFLVSKFLFVVICLIGAWLSVEVFTFSKTQPFFRCPVLVKSAHVRFIQATRERTTEGDDTSDIVTVVFYSVLHWILFDVQNCVIYDNVSLCYH